MIPAILAGAGAVAAATVAGLHTMWPTSQLYGRTFLSEGKGSKRLALTYDDGPNDPFTLHLLDVLQKHNVKATFFVIGQFVKQRPDIVRAVADAGHVVANHTFTHPNLIFRNGAQARREIAECEVAVDDAIGSCSRIFRPPFGGRRPSTLRAAREEGYKTVMWSVSSYDWSATSAAQIVDRVSRHVKGGDVVLLHDGCYERLGTDRSRTVRASDEILRRYHGEGYEFVTVPEMMREDIGVRFETASNLQR